MSKPRKPRFKRGQVVVLYLTGAGYETSEKKTVARVTKDGVYLDNGSGNDQSGPFDPVTGKDKQTDIFGFSRRIE